MNNDIAVLSAVPAHIAAAAAQAAAANAALSAGISVGFSRISLKGSRFRLVQGETETALDTLALPAVILGGNTGVSKTYYMKAWQPGDAEAPDCSSADGVYPDPGVPHPQATVCATCAMNQWGSKVTPAGTQIKACSDVKKLAIVASSAINGEMYLLSVPAASLKPLAQYINMLSQRGVAAHMVETSISFDPDADYPRLKFNVTRFLNADEMAAAHERTNDPMIPMMVGAVSRPAQIAAPDPVAQAQAQALAAQQAQAQAQAQALAAQQAQAQAQALAAQQAAAAQAQALAAQQAAAQAAAAQVAPAGFGGGQVTPVGFGAPATPGAPIIPDAPAAPVAPATPGAGFGAPVAPAASNVVSAPFGGAAKEPARATIKPAGGEIMPPPGDGGLGALVAAALDQFDDE